MTEQEKAIANAIRAAKYEALGSLKGEALITACWVFSTIIYHAELELNKVDSKLNFVEFEQESSIEDE